MSTDIVLACAACGARNNIESARMCDNPACGSCKAPILDPSLPLELDDLSFAAVVDASARPVLVGFCADWCGPCQSFAPALATFAQEHGASVLVAKVNVDLARRVSARLQIRAVPTVAVFSHGKETARHVGAMTVPDLGRLVNVTA